VPASGESDQDSGESDQDSGNCLDPGSCVRKRKILVLLEDRGPSLGPAPPIPGLVSTGTQRAWRPLHILDALLQGLATNRMSMLHFETIVLIHSPLQSEMIPYMYMFYSFQDSGKNHCCVHTVQYICMH
jgi:hypothetical protein